MSKIIIAKKDSHTIIREFKFGFIRYWFYLLKYKNEGYEVETLKGEYL